MSLSIILKVYDGGKLKMARAFKGPSVRLGTGDVELQLQGANVASSHALIELGASAAVLRATSAAPLFLNGQPILAAPLRTGDLITLGALRVMVELREPARMPAPQKRARFQVIDGAADNEPAEPAVHMHAVPSLSVVRGESPAGSGDTPVEASPISAALEVSMPEVSPPAATPISPTPIAAAAAPAPALAQMPDLPPPPRPTLASVGSATDIGFVYAEVHWGDQLIGVQCVEPGKPLTAGEEPGCTVFLPGVPRSELVTSDTGGWHLHAPTTVSLALTRRGLTASGPELLARGLGHMESDGLVAPLAPDACGVLRSGGLSLRVRVVPEAVAVGRGREDWRGVAMTSIAAFALVLAMALMHKFLPPPKQMLIMPAPARPYVVKASAPKAEPAAVEQKKAQAQGRKDPGKAVARHLGREGMAGSKVAPRRDLRAEKKRDDAQIVAQTGLIKALKGGKGTSAVFGTALGTGARDALGHLDGPRVGDARGDGGAGLKSLGGTGGGGDGSGLGLARIGTNGIGGGMADYGDGRGSIKGKTTGVIGLVAGKPEVTGEIDPELIRKVVHDHRAQIRACYELELNQKPKLAGKVTSAWTIDSNGLVTESHVAESTLGDKNVERCVANRIKTWRFPLPKGGGEVFVTYPFIFTRGG